MVAAAAHGTPFSAALRQWEADLKSSKDKGSPFLDRVVAARSKSSLAQNGGDDSEKLAGDLSNYILELEQTRRKESRFTQLCAKLEPFVASIANLVKLCGPALQAAPFEVSLAFAGAQLILQLAAKHAATFDKMVDIMAEIGVNLSCYSKFSAAFETSAELKSLLTDAYTTIITFWHRASQVLGKSCEGFPFYLTVKG
jgi:hypothetical protein